MPRHGMPADAALQLVRDELSLDGQPTLNLASFVTTWMEPQADQLLHDTRNENLIDQDEYPQTARVHERVVSMPGHLINAPPERTPVGTSTVGSPLRCSTPRRPGRFPSPNRRAAGTSAWSTCAPSTCPITSSGWSTRRWARAVPRPR
jgi:glutamate decarboxylase